MCIGGSSSSESTPLTANNDNKNVVLLFKKNWMDKQFKEKIKAMKRVIDPKIMMKYYKYFV